MFNGKQEEVTMIKQLISQKNRGGALAYSCPE